MRAACRATCGTCDSERIEDAIDWRARQRKRNCITYHVHTGKEDAAYQMHDMVCHPPKRAFRLQDDLPYAGTDADGDGEGYHYRSGGPPLELRGA